MSGIKVIEGELFNDYRGRISSMNSFSFEGVERYYLIENKDCDILRGYHGHRFEKKWFHCIRGSFTMSLVKIDDWEHPSRDLKPEIFHVSAGKPRIICVPEGYANCIRADEEGSMLLVYSGKRYPECLSDSWRYDADYWFDWEGVPREEEN